MGRVSWSFLNSAINCGGSDFSHKKGGVVLKKESISSLVVFFTCTTTVNEKSTSCLSYLFLLHFFILTKPL